MRIVNLYNQKKDIYLFLRDEQARLKLRKIKDFYPYYYEPIEGNYDGEVYQGYDGKKLKKIIVNNPKEVKELRSEDSYESDIVFTKRYVIDRIDKFDKTIIKHAFIDIEILHPEDEFPNPKSAKFPVSSISLYTSKYNKIKNWCLLDYGVPNGTKFSDLINDKSLARIVANAEIKLFKDFIDYLQRAKFDILMGWYMHGFDYPYLYNRFAQLPQKEFFPQTSQYNNFAVAISPIGKVRGGNREFSNFYPAGTSIIDYLVWYKDLNKGKKSYALDYVMEEDLGKGKKYKDVNFSEITEIVRKRNIADVQGLVDLEKKHKLLSYYDELRRFAKVFWEDLDKNSRLIDSLILQEAKKKEIILPKAKDNDKEEYEGAFREAFQTGLFSGIGKVDLDSAYPRMIKDFCLDPSNIVKKNSKIKYDMIDVNGITFQQNKEAILPTVANKLIMMKTEIKKDLKNLNPETQEYKDLELRYKAIKSVVNSLYGVTGSRFFRLYDKRVAERVTWLVRKLLKDSIEYYEKLKSSCKVIYADTDGFFTNSKKDISKELNKFIKQWGADNFGNNKISATFDYEGYFEDLLILGLCRYKGLLNKDGKIKEEETGIEAKRKDSTLFMAKFQTDIISKIFNIKKKKETKESIIKWVKQEKERMKTLPLHEIGFPCKIARSIDQYSNVPIFVRAMKYTQELLPKFKKRIGELFYYVYVESMGHEVKIIREPYCDDERLTTKGIVDLAFQNDLIIEKPKKISILKAGEKKYILGLLNEEGLITWKDKETQGKSKDVLAFDEKTYKHVKNVDWKKMLERNILNKCEIIFNALNWKIKSIQ